MGCCGGSNVKNDKFSNFADACYNGNVEKMKELLKKEGGKNPAKFINEVNEDGYTPLHRAAQKGSAEAIRFLLDNNADPKQITQNGETALHIAVFHRNKAAVQELLKSCTKTEVNIRDKQHLMTPLHLAVYRGAPEIAEQLLQCGADPSIEDKYGQDALSMAKFWYEQEMNKLSSPTAQHHKTLAVLEKEAAK